jgi:hypothetical protein
MSTLQVLSERVKELTIRIMQAAERPHQEAISRARQDTVQAENTLQNAYSLLQGARIALRQVQQACGTSDDPAVLNALKAAESKIPLAEEAHINASETLKHVRSQLAIVLEPVQDYIAILHALEVLATAQSGSLDIYGCAVQRASDSALERARAQHPKIAVAEAQLKKVRHQLLECQLSVSKAKGVHASMTEAEAASPIAEIQQAVKVTAELLSSANQAEATANQAVQSATADLNLALQAVQSHLELHSYTLSLREAAQAADHAHEQQLAEQQQSEVLESVTSQCTCWELHHPCDHCRNEQSRREYEARDIDYTR